VGVQPQRGAVEVVEEADAPTEQDRHQVHPELVERAGVEVPLDERRARHGDHLVTGLSPAVVLACASALSMPSVTKVTARSGGASRRGSCG
jgi:hypothetical protein